MKNDGGPLTGKQLDTPLYGWFGDVSIRLINALEAAGKRTLRDVVLMTESDVLRLRSIGETSLRELKRALQQHGLRLGELPPEVAPMKSCDMSLRDYFAGQALVALGREMIVDEREMDRNWNVLAPDDCRCLAQCAYRLADAMLDMQSRPDYESLAAREAPPQQENPDAER